MTMAITLVYYLCLVKYLVLVERSDKINYLFSVVELARLGSLSLVVLVLPLLTFSGKRTSVAKTNTKVVEFVRLPALLAVGQARGCLRRVIFCQDPENLAPSLVNSLADRLENSMLKSTLLDDDAVLVEDVRSLCASHCGLASVVYGYRD